MARLEYKTYQLILEEMISLALHCDITDECNRILLRNTLLEILKGNISDDIISKIFTYLNNTIKNVDHRIAFICEFISDLRNKSENNISEQEYAEYAQKVS